MDSKITLSFDQNVIDQAKAFAERNNISLSRLTEFLLSKAVSGTYRSINELPVSEWIDLVSEGKVEYVRKNSTKSIKKDYLASRRK